VKGGFFLRNEPLECVLSVYTHSKNAILQTKRAGPGINPEPLFANLVRLTKMLYATAFSILLFTETGMLSGFFLKKKPPCMPL
jgi:hypothetical protein